MSADQDPSPPAPPKYARYRSVRSASSLKSQEQGQADCRKDDRNASVSRSRSRYRHTSRGALNAEHSASIPPLPESIPVASAGLARHATEPTSNNEQASEERGRGRQSRGLSQETEAERLRRKRKEAKDYDEEQRRIRQEQEAYKTQQTEEDETRFEEERAVRMLEEQKRKDLERLEAQLAAAGTAPPPTPLSPKEKFTTFFSRKRAGTAATAATTKSSGSGGTSGNDVPQGIQQGGGGIVPGTDAPKSAVNAGERRVLIRCKQCSMSLPVTPETTPADLIHSATNVMTQNIVPSNAILLESYTKLGLERRIRRYEHVRDIINSWDRDTQNALVIHGLASPSAGKDLDASFAPKEAPYDISVYMYHSQKPGKWNKRYITLLSSGQVFVSKKFGSKLGDKEITGTCHLSDFDIYTPTPQQIRKHLRPPKKHCYAIRSQQKTSMFLSTENFVHFFSSDDEEEIERWYVAVQSWRSWYLVNKMGEGQKETKGKTVKEVTTKTSSRGGQTHKVKVSVDEDPFTLGSFKPLLNMDRFTSSDDPTYDSDDENRPLEIPAHLRNNEASAKPKREKKYPPLSFRPPSQEEGEFPTMSLLGRTYFQRQRSQKGQEPSNSNVPVRSSSNGPTHRRTSSTQSRSQPQGQITQRPSNNETSNGRTATMTTSKREKPKPLLVFTPQFEEAPQWSMKGKGRGVTAPEGVTLVEVANGRDAGVEGMGPGGTVFRRS